MSMENMIVFVVELCMVVLGSMMLYTHTKKRWLLALFIMLSIGTIITGWWLNCVSHTIIPLIMIYTIVAVKYSMVQMDKRMDALLGKQVNRSSNQPYKLIFFITVILSGVAGVLLMSSPSEIQTHSESVVAIVLVLVALVTRIGRIVLRRFNDS